MRHKLYCINLKVIQGLFLFVFVKGLLHVIHRAD